VTRSYLEIFFRHRLLVLAPLVLAFVLGTGLAFAQPRTYTAVASLWADAPVTTESTIGTSGGEEPPSTGQQALFTELVGTRGFLLDVVEDSPLARSFQGLDDHQTDRKLTQLRSVITGETAGPHIFKVAVEQKSPENAKELTSVLVDHFMEDQDELLRRRAATETAFLKTQLERAQAAVAAAQRPGGIGIAGGGSLADAVLQTAQQQRLEAEQAYERAVAASQTIGNEGVLYVRDAPDTAVRQSRLKTLILGAGGGLLAGLTVSVALLVLLMARQRSVNDEAELEALLGLTAVGTIDDYGPADGRGRLTRSGAAVPGDRTGSSRR
jgi:uncharacterized protein involved in exopolysaccharide biosynthesis